MRLGEYKEFLGLRARMLHRLYNITNFVYLYREFIYSGIDTIKRDEHKLFSLWIE